MVAGVEDAVEFGVDRGWWADGLGRRIADIFGLATLPADRTEQSVLIELLASSDDDVRRTALFTLGEIGSSAAVELRAARRSNRPLRRGALAALAAIGWDEIEPADRVLVERFIRIRQRTETAQPCYLEADWFAFTTTDRAAVLDALGLVDPVPVTLQAATTLMRGGQEDCSQVCVTPALDGWTLAIFNAGRLCHEDARRFTAELSERFGTAHWYTEYGQSGCGDASAWCVAERGIVAHWCAYNLYGHSDPHADTGGEPFEELRTWVHRNTRLDAPPPSGWHSEKHWELNALDVGRRISVSPDTFGPHTRIEGTAVLAVPYALRGQLRRGALELAAPR